MQLFSKGAGEEGRDRRRKNVSLNRAKTPTLIYFLSMMSMIKMWSKNHEGVKGRGSLRLWMCATPRPTFICDF